MKNFLLDLTGYACAAILTPLFVAVILIDRALPS